MTFDDSVATLMRDTASATRAAVLASLPASASTPTVIRVPASQLIATSGAPVITTHNNVPAWRLPDGVTTGLSISGYNLIPASWATVDIAVVYVVNANGSGDVRWNAVFGYDAEIAGGTSQTFASTGTIASNTVTPAVFTVATGRGAAGWWTDKYTGMGVQRLGADALDTFAPDVNVLGLRLTKAS